MDHALDQIMAEQRPRLHRFAARMTGSAFDGEDVVQDALAKAVAAWDGGARPDAVEGWLFAIVNTTALDALRRRRRREARERAVEHDAAAGGADRRVAVAAGLRAFLLLPPGPRAAVVLADVLGHSAEEVAATLGMTIAAVKAALHRGRGRLRQISEHDVSPALDPDERARLQAYADRFNAHDWDALRALLAEDVRLDLVNRTALAGSGAVGIYYTRYADQPDWHVSIGMAEGRPALLYRRTPADVPAFVVLLGWREGRIVAIRDFHYAQYVMDGLDWSE